MGGGQEIYAATEPADHVFGPRHTAGDEDGIYLAEERGTLGHDTFGRLEDHGFHHQFGMLVTLGYPPLYLFHVVGAEVGDEASLSGHTLEQFFLGEASAEAEAYQVGSGERSGAFG